LAAVVLELVQGQLVLRMLQQQVVEGLVAVAAAVVVVELAPDHKAGHSKLPMLRHWHQLPACLDLGLQELELAPSARTGFDKVLPMAAEHHTVAAVASCLVVAFDQAVDLAVDEEAAFAADVAFLEDWVAHTDCHPFEEVHPWVQDDQEVLETQNCQASEAAQFFH
jgi:hypothetical protein